MSPLGSFSENSLSEYLALVNLKGGLDFAEATDTYDFTRCVRKDGSIYGTAGKCRKGSETSDKKEEKKSTKAPVKPGIGKVKAEKLVGAIMDLYENKHGGSYYGEDTALKWLKDLQKENPNMSVKDAVRDVASEMWQNE